MEKLQVEPQEKKKKKTKMLSPPSFSLLPDEIAVTCLARIPRSYYPKLSTVSKSFRLFISSTELYAARSHLGSTEQFLYGCLWDRSYQFPQWFRLLINPSLTLPNSSVTKTKTSGQLLVPIPLSSLTSVTTSVALVGYEIYVIGGQVDKARSTAVRILNCASNTWRDAPSMKVSRNNAKMCVYDGKIYVLGRCRVLEDDEPWAEVFDTKTQTWEPLPDPGTKIRQLEINIIKEMEGKIYFGLSMIRYAYAYDIKQGIWECCENKSATFEEPECVIGNVTYRYDRNGSINGQYIQWYDRKDGRWNEVQGLDSLREKHLGNGGASNYDSKLVSCGGNLIFIWEDYMKHCPNDMKKIWCAEIELEKREGGEVSGYVEWVDVVHSIPKSCHLLHCLSVSV